MAGAPRLLLSASLLLAVAEAVWMAPKTPAEALVPALVEEEPAAVLQDGERLSLLEPTREQLGDNRRYGHVQVEIGERGLQGEVQESEDMGGAGSNGWDSWDQAVTEVVGELHPLEAVPPPVAIQVSETTGIDGQPSLERKPDRRLPPLLHWVYGANHKSGTDLLRHLAVGQGIVTGSDMCLDHGLVFGYLPEGCEKRKKPAAIMFECSFNTTIMDRLKDLGIVYRGVNIIRDPIAMVVSGYLYHMNEANNLDTPDYMLKMRRMPPVQGLTYLAEVGLNTTLSLDMLKNMRSRKGVMRVRFESFVQSSASFDATVKTVYDHMINEFLGPADQQLLLQMAKVHDLRRSNADKGYGHITSRKRKAEVRKLLDLIPHHILSKLKEARALLGYTRPPYNSDPGFAMPAHR